ncbi:MAG: DNA-directed RNA polymerase subunit alpha C-terminal domain-containing protein [Sedimentisphaerales bacterium]
MIRGTVTEVKNGAVDGMSILTVETTTEEVKKEGCGILFSAVCLTQVIPEDKKEKIQKLLKKKVDELEFSVCTSNCLRAANIRTLADLVRNSESDMIKYRTMTRKSLIELNSKLGELGLSFRMEAD